MHCTCIMRLKTDSGELTIEKVFGAGQGHRIPVKLFMKHYFRLYFFQKTAWLWWNNSLVDSNTDLDCGFHRTRTSSSGVNLEWNWQACRNTLWINSSSWNGDLAGVWSTGLNIDLEGAENRRTLYALQDPFTVNRIIITKYMTPHHEVGN